MNFDKLLFSSMNNDSDTIISIHKRDDYHHILLKIASDPLKEDDQTSRYELVLLSDKHMTAKVKSLNHVLLSDDTTIVSALYFDYTYDLILLHNKTFIHHIYDHENKLLDEQIIDIDTRNYDWDISKSFVIDDFVYHLLIGSGQSRLIVSKYSEVRIDELLPSRTDNIYVYDNLVFVGDLIIDKISHEINKLSDMITRI
jgi:hypothetical protein